MNHRNYFWGILLILIGVGALLNNIFGIRLFTIGQLWPLFILLPGLSFEASYFISGRAPGVLVPGGILTTLGVLFLFETFTNWYFSAYTWPVYILSVAIGLFQLYLFGGRQRGLLIPVFILTTISVVSFASILFGSVLHWLNSGLILPIILIVIGASMLFRNSRA